ncbi:ABC transporter permease [Agromyces atrinae]|uniref:ABC transporter permease n=1 Tax=Agromyces atrinae TaxID=592376 RepID=A0A4Q2MCQ6_9MICO|nr:ABC transporter permease [Agromyces atrinae]NYD67299.1 peptide/nickel transport system permease protein [Agromyces atrinae]RXZ86870.1 ABC transporter permease [Agromyces atrinae]
MIRYLAVRLAQAVGVLWAAYTVSFLVLYALPGDPVRLLAGADANDLTEAQLDALRAQFGLDRPLIVQYADQLVGVLRGDLGTSLVTGRPVTVILGEALGPTAVLAAAALVLAVVLGSLIAIAANYTRHRWLANTLLALPPLGVAIPGFWFGLLLIQWFSFGIPLFPAVGDSGFASIVLPAIALSLPTGAMIAQLLSKSLSTTLREPYIDTAWSKGADRARVHLRHALRNAALPALTVTGLVVGQLLSGTVVTETVFSRPGIGRLTASAVQQQDIPVVQGVVVFAAVVFVVVNLLVDLIYPLLDPRIVTVGRRSRKTRATNGGGPTTDDGALPTAAAERPRELVEGVRS